MNLLSAMPHLVNDPLLKKLLDNSGLPTTGAEEHLLDYTLQAFSRIPYENISKIDSFNQLGIRSAKHTPKELISSYISKGTGGTCFPLTLTLTHFINSLGYEAHPILADRRYGSDTHCAVIFRRNESPWRIVDPGYLINSPCALPSQNLSVRYQLGFTTIELRHTGGDKRVELFTSIGSAVESPRYRLTYKIEPVDWELFHSAWDRSFTFEMMEYPVISLARGGAHVYIQKDTITVRDGEIKRRLTLSNEELVLESSRLTGIDRELLGRVIK
jgi:hypothetical protein